MGFTIEKRNENDRFKQQNDRNDENDPYPKKKGKSDWKKSKE